jgi:hypothetical protein
MAMGWGPEPDPKGTSGDRSWLGFGVRPRLTRVLAPAEALMAVPAAWSLFGHAPVPVVIAGLVGAVTVCATITAELGWRALGRHHRRKAVDEGQAALSSGHGRS